MTSTYESTMSLCSVTVGEELMQPLDVETKAPKGRHKKSYFLGICLQTSTPPGKKVFGLRRKSSCFEFLGIIVFDSPGFIALSK